MIAGAVTLGLIALLLFVAGALRAAGNYDDRWGQ